MQYCTPSQLLDRYDARTIGQLVHDQNAEVDPATLLLDPILKTHLASASGKIEAALLQGNRYTIADLETIAAVDPETTPNDPLANNSAWLIQLTADIAFSTLWRRRTWDEGDIGITIGEAADAELEKLRNGQMVFNLPAVAAAGVGWIGGASAVDVSRLNMIVDQATINNNLGYYPRRREPFDR